MHLSAVTVALIYCKNIPTNDALGSDPKIYSCEVKFEIYNFFLIRFIDYPMVDLYVKGKYLLVNVGTINWHKVKHTHISDKTERYNCEKLCEPGHEKMCLMSYANNKGADQPAHPRSLISAFVARCLDSIISLDSIGEISRL